MNSRNAEMIKTINDGLKKHVVDFVFVGGAVLELYIDDAAAGPSRETDDVDIVIEAITQARYDLLEEKLRETGFKNVINGPKCRFQYKNVILDISPVNEIAGSITNIWYNSGFENSVPVRVNDIEIKIFPVEYFIASKLEAFKSRGNNDLLKSHDLEDIVYILDGRKDIMAEIKNSDPKILEYLINNFRTLLANPSFSEALSGHLGYISFPERKERIINILKLITK